MVKQVKPAIVNIFTVKVVKLRGGGNFGGPGFRFNQPNDGFRSPEEEFFNNFFGFPGAPPREFKERALGSGFIFDPAGYVITNNHVVEGAEDIKVKLEDGQEIPAKVIGKDPKTDIALLKLDKDGPYPYISFGDSDRVEIGDWVVAVGNPYGLEHTVTAGILSARGRAIGAGPYDDFLQTDASINPGNSGGPLLNLQGEVVGINTMIVYGGNGIGFAIPSTMATKVVDKLKSVGRVDRGWLGVIIQEVTPELAQYFGLKEPRGALIGQVQPDTPAAQAGFKEGDIVLNFDGKDIKQFQDLSSFVADTDVGKEAKVVVFRDKKENTLTVKVGLLPDAAQSAPGSGTSPEDIGLQVRELTPDLARSLGVPPGGVVVQNVDPSSAAAQAGIRPNDVILKIDDKDVKSLNDFQLALNGHAKGEAYVFWLKRGDINLFLSFDQ
ncbi:MAG: Do family serine endopeptidase [Deltaproteobacteria bacterium]|jgi:serine protease Do|nr:Do family serine endopeptidase [Deltaproteobacteria bacterium]